MAFPSLLFLASAPPKKAAEDASYRVPDGLARRKIAAKDAFLSDLPFRGILVFRRGQKNRAAFSLLFSVEKSSLQPAHPMFISSRL